VKRFYLTHDLAGTVVTTRVDGMPHRVLRTDLVNSLERSAGLRGLLSAVANANRFRAQTGLSWSTLVRQGLRLHKEHDFTWAQVVMAANTPMLLKSGLVEGRTDAGVLASGQVVGLLDDLPSCQELITGIVGQATEILEKLGKVTAG
jgi:NAD(P)H-dependent flavin oxidoreductase YrpB (nitropropane dioxygenase family)